MIKVVNKRTHQPRVEDVYIGRGSVLGNKYTHIPTKTQATYIVSSREEAISSYKRWINGMLNSNDIDVRRELNNIYTLAKHGNVNLVCYCSPQRCHGDILKEMIEEKLEQRKLTCNGSGK